MLEHAHQAVTSCCDEIIGRDPVESSSIPLPLMSAPCRDARPLRPRVFRALGNAVRHSALARDVRWLIASDARASTHVMSEHPRAHSVKTQILPVLMHILRVFGVTPPCVGMRACPASGQMISGLQSAQKDYAGARCHRRRRSNFANLDAGSIRGRTRVIAGNLLALFNRALEQRHRLAHALVVLFDDADDLIAALHLAQHRGRRLRDLDV